MLEPAYPRTLSEVGAQFVGDGSWRLVNTAIDGADAASVLGFVQRVGGSYEVMRLDHPGDATRVHSLREARALLVRARE
jgi:hypothetical protein